MKDLMSLDPISLCEELVKVTEYYRILMEGQSKLDENYAKFFEDNRKELNSDAATRRRWEMTTDGQKYLKNHHKIKSNEKLMSTIKKLIEVRGMEARNQF
jgi:hypothetical protein